MTTDIQFVEVDAGVIQQELIQQFEQALGVTLYPGDERLIFLQQLTQVIVAQKNTINDSARQNLLRYARGETLDAWGERYGDRGNRLLGQKAAVPIRVSLSAVVPLEVIIPKGTRITPDGKIFFGVTNDLRITSGQMIVDGYAEALEDGSIYNGIPTGYIKNIVDPIPYVSSIVNTDVSSGGADIETDDSYRDRLWILPESFSTAGPEGAYIFWAKTADVNIIDVAVDSPSPGVIRIVPLLKDGEIPTQSVLDKVLVTTSAKDRRPLCDNVQVDFPIVVNYNISLTYYLDAETKAEEVKYRQAIEGVNLDCGPGSAIYNYILWQKSKLGREINPDQLRFYIQNAALYQTSGFLKTAVKRIAVTEPFYFSITLAQVAKAGTITVNYGGLE